MEILCATILSDGTQHVAPLRDRLVAELRKQPVAEESIIGILIAFEEALVNAIKHGNQSNPKKYVSVRAAVQPGELLIEVEDQGKGFNVADVPDPTAPENLERPCGRGLLIMRAYMTVDYERGGTLVRMRKILQR